MPLIGIYRGRDRTDNIFEQEYVLTELPFGVAGSGAINFFSQTTTADFPTFSVGTQLVDVFSLSNTTQQETDFPTFSVGTQPVDVFFLSDVAKHTVELSFNVQGGAA